MSGGLVLNDSERECVSSRSIRDACFYIRPYLDEMGFSPFPTIKSSRLVSENDAIFRIFQNFFFVFST